MVLSPVFMSTALLAASTLVSALPAPNALADAYGQAVAMAHPDPEAFAMAISDEGTCATSSCRTSCNLMIIGGTQCTSNTTNPYAGPYDTDCLCSSNSNLMRYYSACLECGWTLWNNYGPYASSALAACDLPTEPTGTASCSTKPTTTVANCIEEGNCFITNADPVLTVKTTTVGKPAYTIRTTGKTTSLAADYTFSTTSSDGLTTDLGKPAYVIRTPSTSSSGTTTLAADFTVSTTPSESSATLAAESEVESLSLTTNLGVPAYAIKSVSKPASAPSGSTTTLAADYTIRTTNLRESVSDVETTSTLPSSSVVSTISTSSVEPQFVGMLSSGTPEWSLSIPGYLGPWTSIELEISDEDSVGEFEYTHAVVYLNGKQVDDAQITITSTSVTVVYDAAIGQDDELTVKYGGKIISGSSWTSVAHIAITQTSAKFVKRDVITYDLSSTITADSSDVSSEASTEASIEDSTETSSETSTEVSSSETSTELSSSEVSSSETSELSSSEISTEASSSSETSELSSSEISTEASSSSETSELSSSETSETSETTEDSSSSSSSDASLTTEASSSEASETLTNITSTTTEEIQSTTIITITSCSDDVCSTITAATGITVVTETVSGSVTSYTTYCPVTSDEVSTTVLTVTSCDENDCTLLSTTIGLEGETITYETYVPIETEENKTTTVGEATAVETVEETTTAKVTSETAAEGQLTTEVEAQPTSEVTVSSEGSTSSSPSITLFEGSASKMAGSTLVGLLLGFLFI